MMRVVVIDDEPLVRENVRLRLRAYEDIEITGEFGSGAKAIEGVNALEPDLLFLDIQMPEVDGFDVVDRLSHDPHIIFLTAHDQYAVRAFEVNAVDYLLKPISANRFEEALHRARQSMSERRTSSSHPSVSPDRSPLFIRSRGNIHIVQPGDVRYLESAGDYVKVHTAERTHLMRAALKRLTEDLGDQMVRIHRSAAVRASSIRMLTPIGHHEFRVELDDGTTLKCSRTYRSVLMDALGSDAPL